MYKVCLTNDDGPRSEGMLKLAEVLNEVVELIVVVPDAQRSATGKSLTLKRPIRITEKHDRNGYQFVSHDGAPADSVILAQAFYEDIDLVISGINSGANVGYQSMLTSGTVGAAFEAAIRGLPAIAVSRQAIPSDWFGATGSNGDCERMCEITKDLVMKVLKKGMPEGIDMLNLNFPRNLADNSKIVVTIPTIVRMHNEVEKRTDPNGRPYYWYLGIERDPQPKSDAYEVFVNGNVSISPVILNWIGEREVKKLEEFMND
ncbi:MAG: 5'-nucleotidase SurE1 [Candidatus Thorarchaeota archaeon AB_25]|nr:MAG: 5'-nucleotidase SurE1 [Candidatus Thorarchaeota archaeon AB_25]